MCAINYGKFIPLLKRSSKMPNFAFFYYYLILTGMDSGNAKLLDGIYLCSGKCICLCYYGIYFDSFVFSTLVILF